jgi:hypothetical protein
MYALRQSPVTTWKQAEVQRTSGQYEVGWCQPHPTLAAVLVLQLSFHVYQEVDPCHTAELPQKSSGMLNLPGLPVRNRHEIAQGVQACHTKSRTSAPWSTRGWALLVQLLHSECAAHASMYYLVSTWSLCSGGACRCWCYT